MERSKRVFDLTKIHNPPCPLLDRTSHVDLDPEGVAMESGALMVLRYIGQSMRRFDRELLEDLHDHPPT